MQIEQLQVALHTVNTQAVAKNSQDQPWVFSGWNCYAKISPGENFATFLNGEILPAKFSPGEIPPPLYASCRLERSQEVPCVVLQYGLAGLNSNMSLDLGAAR